MSVFSFIPPARPWDAVVFSTFYGPFSPLAALFFHIFSSVSCPFQADVCCNLPLLRPTLSISTCHCCSSSALTAFSARTLTAMPLASTHLAPFCSISKVLHTPASTQTYFYTNQLLHKPAFTQTRFYTSSLFHKPPFTPTSFYHCKPASTRTTFSASQPFIPHPALHNPCFGPVGQRPEGRPSAEGC